ncbi:MAG: redox-regulated ATPase YchF [Candidatus Peribacteraceae bacterium]|nr:redox-regulated ATPase YchF [Candidatus Peribacteraceae bacterium]MDD5743014.1 redox-regulated ATPase YchF [Candidatus Peribacteraceae bacterium]
MPLKIGIVGIPNVGKSTLFNALTKTRGAQAQNYPFCTIEPNVGVVEVPDPRLAKLAELVHPEKIIPAAIEFVDIAGLVRGASKGEGLGNQFLAAIREADAICEVVRLFEGGDIIHVEGSVNGRRDRETVETELCLADLDVLERRIEKARGAARTGDKEKQRELTLIEKLLAVLKAGNLASTANLSPEERFFVQSFQLLTFKPVIYAANVGEQELHRMSAHSAREVLGLPASAQVIIVSAKIEEDLQDLPPEEAEAFLKELSVTSSGLDQLITAAYDILGYQTYFTAGPQEVRAWTIRKGSTAPQAAGVIHSDFEKGFIRAETIAYGDYVTLGGELKAKEAGKMRSEGKDYVVQNGDVMHFRFSS